jgi:hypothetical protein
MPYPCTCMHILYAIAAHTDCTLLACMYTLSYTTIVQAGGALSVTTGTTAATNNATTNAVNSSDPSRSTTETGSYNLPMPGSPRVPRALRNARVHVAPPDSP